MGQRENRRDNEAKVFEFLQSRVLEERQGAQDSKGRRSSTALVREKMFLEDLEESLTRVFKKGIAPPRGYAAKSLDTHKKKRIVNLLLSDLHYGSLLDPRELPLAFGHTEESRRTAQIVQETCEYKSQYRDDTELFVFLAGDIIQGDLHDPRDAANLTDQCGAALYLLLQAVTRFAACYKRVTVRCVPGNHGRRKRRHPERATTQKWDSIENSIYMALKFAVATLPNVEVIIPYEPYIAYTCFSQKGFVTHGDTVMDVGFPSGSIQVAKIRNQINEINAGDEQYDLFAVGHVHTASVTELPSGSTLITNGALIPPDGYAVSRGILRCRNGQQLWESVDGYICGDRRFLMVDEKTDKDANLDKIIQPYAGFESQSPLAKRRK